MAATASHNIQADLARLDEEAQQAGCALACAHQSAEEFHHDLIRRYFALHARRRSFAVTVSLTALFLLFLL